MQRVNFLESHLEAGDCLYVPAYYYVQSETTTKDGYGRTVLLTHHYESHSRMIDIIFEGIENEIFGKGDDEHKYDKMLSGYLDNVLT